MDYTFSNQAVGAIMMALQKSLMEQTDITHIISGFQVQVTDNNQLVIINAPVLEVKEEAKQDIETSVQ